MIATYLHDLRDHSYTNRQDLGFKNFLRASDNYVEGRLLEQRDVNYPLATFQCLLIA